MKRIIAAVSFAVLAVPALAAEVGAPFEQNELDRALPQLEIPVAASGRADSASLPFEQSQLDRGLPSLAPEYVRFAAVSGNTTTDATDAASAESPWKNDHNFIAPAQ